MASDIIHFDGERVTHDEAICRMRAAGCPSWMIAVYFDEKDWVADGTIKKGPNKGKPRRRNVKTGQTRVAKDSDDEHTKTAKSMIAAVNHVMDHYKEGEANVPDWHGPPDMHRINEILRDVDNSHAAVIWDRMRSLQPRLHDLAVRDSRYTPVVTSTTDLWHNLQGAVDRHVAIAGHREPGLTPASRSGVIPPELAGMIESAKKLDPTATAMMADWLHEHGHERFADNLQSKWSDAPHLRDVNRWKAEAVEQHFKALGTQHDLAKVRMAEVPVISSDRRPTDLARMARKLLSQLGIKGVSITSGRYIQVRIPYRQDFGNYNSRDDYWESQRDPANRANKAARDKLKAIIHTAFPNTDDRSRSEMDHFDFIWSFS